MIEEIGEVVLCVDKAQRRGRRLSDKIEIAFHHACDQAEIDVAVGLLKLLELISARNQKDLPADLDRRMQTNLVAAYERLWHLRHPGSS